MKLPEKLRCHLLPQGAVLLRELMKKIEGKRAQIIAQIIERLSSDEGEVQGGIVHIVDFSEQEDLAYPQLPENGEPLLLNLVILVESLS